jgi:hypothetical protein
MAVTVAATAVVVGLVGCGGGQGTSSTQTAAMGITQTQGTDANSVATGQTETKTAETPATGTEAAKTGTTPTQGGGVIGVEGSPGRVAPGSRRACIKWAQGWPAPQRRVILGQCSNLPR